MQSQIFEQIKKRTLPFIEAGFAFEYFHQKGGDSSCVYICRYKKGKDYSKNRKDLETYYNVGKLLIDAQGGEERAKYGDRLIKEYSKKLTFEVDRKYGA